MHNILLLYRHAATSKQTYYLKLIYQGTESEWEEEARHTCARLLQVLHAQIFRKWKYLVTKLAYFVWYGSELAQLPVSTGLSEVTPNHFL